MPNVVVRTRRQPAHTVFVKEVVVVDAALGENAAVVEGLVEADHRRDAQGFEERHVVLRGPAPPRQPRAEQGHRRAAARHHQGHRYAPEAAQDSGQSAAAATWRVCLPLLCSLAP